MPALSPTLELAFELIRRPSVTPADEGCQALMCERLAAAGFSIEPMRIEEVTISGPGVAATARCCALPDTPTWCRPGRWR